jgi:hypothetical protein
MARKRSTMKSLLSEAMQTLAPERRIVTAGDRKWLRSLLASGYLPEQLAPVVQKAGWTMSEQEIAALAPRPRKPKKRADAQTAATTNAGSGSSDATPTARADSAMKGERTPSKGTGKPKLPTPGGFPVHPDADDL